NNRKLPPPGPLFRISSISPDASRLLFALPEAEKEKLPPAGTQRLSHVLESWGWEGGLRPLRSYSTGFHAWKFPRDPHSSAAQSRTSHHQRTLSVKLWRKMSAKRPFSPDLESGRLSERFAY